MNLAQKSEQRELFTPCCVSFLLWSFGISQLIVLVLLPAALRLYCCSVADLTALSKTFTEQHLPKLDQTLDSEGYANVTHI